MVADLEQPNGVKALTKADKLRDAVRRDAILIGVRPAARKHGVNERTALTWSHREHWKLPQCLATMRFKGKHGAHLDASKAREIATRTLGELAESIDEQGEHSRLYLSAATLQASHTLAAQGGKTDGERVPYAGLLNVSRSGDTVHGWQAQRTAGPTVQIANVVMPTPEEKAERQAMFAKLEEITKRLAVPASE